MSSTLTPIHGSLAPLVIQDFLVLSLPSNLSSSTMSLAVIYFLHQATSAPTVAFKRPNTPYHRLARLPLPAHRPLFLPTSPTNRRDNDSKAVSVLSPHV